jgi:hypothetical protein
VTAGEAGAPAVILDHVWVGAGIHIHTGGPAEAREPFLPWRDLPDDPDAVFALLSWHARLAPLTGRERDRETLLQWARQGHNARIRLLSGPGGVGKSRLAAEVADALRAVGWPAGFIRPNDPIVVPLRRAGLFLVVDYPEEHPDEVRTLLREVASRELGDVPVRLLVLSREGGDRWFDLVESAHAGELMDAQEVRLSGLAAAEPERLFSGALCRLAEHYPRAIPAVPSDAVRSWVGLNPGLHGLPLLLTAAAIHMFLNPDAALGFSGASVIQALTDREWARLANTGRAAGLPDRRSAGRAVALASVPGSLDASALRRLAEPTLEMGLPPPDRVIDAINTVPWWHEGRVPAPQPDIMAAALLLKILSERSGKAPEWLWAVIEGAIAAPLIDRLGRLTFDAMIVRFCPRPDAIFAKDHRRRSVSRFQIGVYQRRGQPAVRAGELCSRHYQSAAGGRQRRGDAGKSPQQPAGSSERCRRRRRRARGDPRGGRRLSPSGAGQPGPLRPRSRVEPKQPVASSGRRRRRRGRTRTRCDPRGGG